MFVACGIWCLADVSSVSPSSEQTAQTRIQRTRPRRKTVFFKTSLRVAIKNAQAAIYLKVKNKLRIITDQAAILIRQI